jgi:hypothetical protein
LRSNTLKGLLAAPNDEEARPPHCSRGVRAQGPLARDITLSRLASSSLSTFLPVPLKNPASAVLTSPLCSQPVGRWLMLVSTRRSAADTCSKGRARGRGAAAASVCRNHMHWAAGQRLPGAGLLPSAQRVWLFAWSEGHLRYALRRSNAASHRPACTPAAGGWRGAMSCPLARPRRPSPAITAVPRVRAPGQPPTSCSSAACSSRTVSSTSPRNTCRKRLQSAS